MERNPYNPEARGAGKWWLALAVGVTAVDVCCKETLSNGFRRAIESENTLTKLGTLTLAGVTFGHLLDIIPEKIDPIDNFSREVGKLGSKIMEWTTEGVHLP